MKRRFADARSNDNIIDKEFKNYYINEEEFVGNISVLKINKVKNKWEVDEEGRCILDNNYTWLEMYPEEDNYCITIMCDENHKVKEWYFDICMQNGIEDNVPFEDDLYLDVVIVPDGRVHILDEDELMDAYNNKIITKDNYELAYEIKDKIFNKYVNNKEGLEKMTQKYISKFLY